MNLFGQNFTENLLPYDGKLNYMENFLTPVESQMLFEEFLQITPWQHDIVQLFGKEYITKRKMAFYADYGVQYSYSKRVKSPLIWTNQLLKLKKKVEETCGASFNSCLLNLYHQGEEGMSWHSDDEKELGENPAIASISLGAARKFCWKHKATKIRYDKILTSGSLLFMHGTMQRYWLHAIPKTKKITEARINLSFRQIHTIR